MMASTSASGFFGDGAAATAVESVVGAAVSAEILAASSLKKRGMGAPGAMGSFARRILAHARAGDVLLTFLEVERLALYSGVAVSALTELPGGIFRDADTIGLNPAMRDGLCLLVDAVLSSFLDEAKHTDLVHEIHGQLLRSPPKHALEADATLAHCMAHAARLSPPAHQAFDLLLRRVRPSASAHERLEVLRSLPGMA